MQLNNLSPHERKLYISIGLVLVVAFAAGLLGALVNFGDGSNNNSDNWQASSLAEAEDTQSLYAIVTEPSRWYQDPALAAIAQAKQGSQQQQSLEGQPESFKLLGIVERDGKKVALFMPPTATATLTARKISALSEGDTLVGDWKIKELTASKVILMAEREGADPEINELMLYRSKKP